MRKIYRDVLNLFEELGCTKCVLVKGKRLMRVECIHDGKAYSFPIHCTPSDRRHMLNLRATVHQALKETGRLSYCYRREADGH